MFRSWTGIPYRNLARSKRYTVYKQSTDADAAGKPPAGVLGGNTFWFGSYAECSQLHGRSCTALLRLPLMKHNRRGRLKPIVVKYTACMPPPCNAADFKRLLLGVNRSGITVTSTVCNAIEEKGVDGPALPIMSVLDAEIQSVRKVRTI